MAPISKKALAEMGFSASENGQRIIYSKGRIRLLYNDGWIVYNDTPFEPMTNVEPLHSIEELRNVLTELGLD